MPGKSRPSLRRKTLKNVGSSDLSYTDKHCINDVFELVDTQEKELKVVSDENLKLIQKNERLKKRLDKLATLEKHISAIVHAGGVYMTEEEQEQAYERVLDSLYDGLTVKLEAYKEYEEALLKKMFPYGVVDKGEYSLPACTVHKDILDIAKKLEGEKK